VPAVKQEVLTKILVAVGGSESSFSALNHALDLASAAESSPTVLIVQETFITPELILARGHDLRRLAEELAAAVRCATDETEREVRELANRRKPQIDIDRQAGHVGDCVVAAAAHASLLVLGRQGHYVMRNGLLGSNTESIVRRTHKPMLIAPREYCRVKRVLVAFGGKDLGGLALNSGREIAETLGVSLEVLTVADKPAIAEAIQQKARGQFVNVRQGTTFVMDHGDPATEIIARCAFDTLVVMGAYGHSRLYNMMLGSVTEQVVRFAQGPVLLSAKPATIAS
jgi:nucleotide-binding universal stress UspA family protein